MKNPEAQKLGKLGGAKRWKGKTAAEKKAHALIMVEARKKLSPKEE